MANIWDRLMTALRVGYTTFKEQALIPEYMGEWDEYDARLFRYTHNAAYYNNTAYNKVSTWSRKLKHDRELYKHVRGVYNPVARLVNIYVSKVYGGQLDYNDLSGGAIPIETDNEAVREALKDVWRWSNWGAQKNLYVRYGAMLGDSAIKIVDDRVRQKVRMEVLHPAKIKEITQDEAGNIKRAVIEYPRVWTDDEGKEHIVTYTEIIDKNEFVTLKDNEEYPFYQDFDGEPISRWSNDYGFVPLVVAQHVDLGLEWGSTAFQPAIGKIDEANDTASLLNDNIRKHVEILWYFAGVQNKGEITASGKLGDGTATTDATAQRDKLPAVYGPKDSQPFALTAPIDIGNAAQNIQYILEELERDLPELALHRIRERGQMTAPGIRAGFNDAIDKIAEAMGNYDDPLVRAQQMAISIGGYRQYLPGFNLDSYEAGDLDHYIKERPVIEDALTKQERIAVFQGLPDKPEQARLILKELQVADEDIESVVNEISANASANNPQPLDGATAQLDETGMADLETVYQQLGINLNGRVNANPQL